MIATSTVLAVLANPLGVAPAYGEAAAPADRSLVVSAWQEGGVQVRLAAEAALLGSDAQVSTFLAEGWERAQRLDQRDNLTRIIGNGGPALRVKAQAALDADAAGDQNAIPAFLTSGWQSASDIDARVSVNQVMAAGGEQVKQAAQAVLDSGDAQKLREFLETGWQVQWRTDQRLRINQAMAIGGPQVRAAGQKALDAGTPEAMDQFLAYGWAVASARDDEVATLQDLLGQARAAGALAAQETANAVAEAERAKESAAAARRSAEQAAAATEAARDDMAEAKAQAQRAATAAQQAADAAQVAVEAAAGAIRAARAAAHAAAMAARMASKANKYATAAYLRANEATLDASKAADARRAAAAASAIAKETRGFVAVAEEAAKAFEAMNGAVAHARNAAQNALAAAMANDQAVRYANVAGVAAREAVEAAARARANAERAVRAARAAENYLAVAIDAATKARNAANRAAANAEAAAAAALEAAEHAGEAAEAAQRATAYANAATAAAEEALATAAEAADLFEAARTADAERLALARDEALEKARAANAADEAQQRVADWDVDQAAKRDAETNRLIVVVLDPAIERAAAVAAPRKVALNLAQGQGAWTKQAALAALKGADDLALEFVRTGLAEAVAHDNRLAVTNLSVTENAALRTAANTALAGSDQTVATFLRTQNYPGRYSADRAKVNQILTAAKTAGDVVLAERAQQALNTDTLQALRDFLDTGQYTAATIGERVLVNQVLASPDSGPEVKAAAQIALEGPAPGLRQFLSTGRFIAAERDHESAVHLAVVAGLHQKISQIAETAVEDALKAQSVAAQARHDAAQAASYAEQARASANRAAGFAQRASTYADNAAASVDKAAAAVRTARAAATRATSSARSAIRSATWAIHSHQLAVNAANMAYKAASAAYDAARRAGKEASAALDAGKVAFDAYDEAYGAAIYQCGIDYGGEDLAEWEDLLDPGGEWHETCIRNIVADPDELIPRAYMNSGFCTLLYAPTTQLYQNCVQSTLDPAFRGVQNLAYAAELGGALMTSWAFIQSQALGIYALGLPSHKAISWLTNIYTLGSSIYNLIQGDKPLSEILADGLPPGLGGFVEQFARHLSVGAQALNTANAAAGRGQGALYQVQLTLSRVQAVSALPTAQAMLAGDYTTIMNTAFFWSGRSATSSGQYLAAGPEAAAAIAREMGGITLETLMGIRGIPHGERNSTHPLMVEVWQKVAAAYARGVSGEVRAVLGQDLGPHSIWKNVECPALMANPNVTKVVVIDLTTRATKVISTCD
ncbi:hypothetical protein AB0M50_07095 [Nonomuraea fuscirosea]|uniref:hypothetical protein n=1 Tax=Nonomuraea fuscirosea TaxID=1291556 RepID=UPI0034271A22